MHFFIISGPDRLIDNMHKFKTYTTKNNIFASENTLNISDDKITKKKILINKAYKIFHLLLADFSNFKHLFLQRSKIIWQ